MRVLVAVAAVGAAFWLEGRPHFLQICSKVLEHVLDDMIRSNVKNSVSNVSREMAISQMPRETHELVRVVMPDFDNQLRGSLDLEPLPIFQLQTVPIGHRNRFRKVEKNFLSLIRH